MNVVHPHVFDIFEGIQEGKKKPFSLWEAKNQDPMVPTEEGFCALPPLPYPEGGLEPYIKKSIMKLHYGLYHDEYVHDWNNTLRKYKKAAAHRAGQKDQSEINDLLHDINHYGAGCINHCMFRTSMTPKKQGGGGKPKEKVAKQIDASFGSFDAFKKEFIAKADLVKGGSGFLYLGWNMNQEKLQVVTTLGQDSCWETHGLVPVLTIDIGYPAYYHQYKHIREYVSAVTDGVLNWTTAEVRYEDALEQTERYKKMRAAEACEPDGYRDLRDFYAF